MCVCVYEKGLCDDVMFGFGRERKGAARERWAQLGQLYVHITTLAAVGPLRRAADQNTKIPTDEKTDITNQDESTYW